MGTRTLNILNGQVMFNYFKEYDLTTDGVYIPFNEAMCEGEATEQIFSDAFLRERSKAHDVSLEMYTEITLNPLRPLLENEYDLIRLWFDSDMFCQLNCLTVLAYLEQKSYKGAIQLNLVDNTYKTLKIVDITPQDYGHLYKEVVLYKRHPDAVYPPVMSEGIKLYLSYKKDDNELINYIKKHRHLKKQELLNNLFKEFKSYGLGDTQYLQLINKILLY